MGTVRDLTPEEITDRENKTAIRLGKKWYPTIPKWDSEVIFSADRRVDDPRGAIVTALGIAALVGSVFGWIVRVAWVKYIIN